MSEGKKFLANNIIAIAVRDLIIFHFPKRDVWSQEIPC